MFGSRHRKVQEDPAVSLVEAALATAATSQGPRGPLTPGRKAVECALWICACITLDDSPNWLIYATTDGSFGWHRVPDGVEPRDLVDARSIAGGHADPADVLAWIRGELSDPWGTIGSGSSDAGVLDRLQTLMSRSGET